MFDSNVFNTLLDRYKNNKLGHAYIFNTNDTESVNRDLIKFIKQILCESDFSVDCTKCNLCNLIDKDNLPDLLTIHPDGMSIKKQQILDLKNKFMSKPVFSKFNIYIVHDCDAFNDSSANSILKFLEEPETDILGFYITTNVEKVISTLKSRCEIINVYYGTDEYKEYQSNDVMNYIMSYIILDHKESSLIYNSFNILFPDIERKDIISSFESYLYFANNYINNESDDFIIRELIKKDKLKDFILLLQKSLIKLKCNVNLEMFLIDFAVEMRNLYE